MTMIDLTGLWRFQPDPAGTGLLRDYAGVGYDDHRWREVRVPVDFETCHPALDTYEGTGWFRRWVEVPVDWDGRRVALRFEGINAHARVWVNGFEAGAWDDSFLPYTMDVQNLLEPGEPNLIVARIDNERRPGDVPGMQRGWRNFGGILREVTLAATDPCYLTRVAVAAAPYGGGEPAEEPGGLLELEAFVRNTRDEGITVQLAVTLSAARRAGETPVLARLVSEPHLVPVGAEVPVGVSGPVPGVAAWSPDHPTLYAVRVALLEVAPEEDAAIADVAIADAAAAVPSQDAVSPDRLDHRDLRIGFRTVEARDGRLWLNGAPLFLTGYNRHEDSPTTNMCPDPELTRRDLVAMKEAGANFVRLCHYPHHPSELALCDELGLLAMGEIPLYWWQGRQEGEAAAAQKLATARRQLETMIWRDRAHPAVIFWSVSNETHEDRPEVAAGNAELVALAQALDPTRLAVHVSDHWRDHPHFDGDDVICVNGYPSVGPLTNPDVRASAADAPPYDLVCSTDAWRDGLSALHARYPGKPILVTEFGYTSFLGVVDNAYAEDLHAAVLEAEFAGMDAAYVCGATVWCWADHAWPPATFAFCGYLAVSPYGVVTRDRRRKQPFAAARRLFRGRRGLVEPTPARRLEPGPAGYEVHMIRPHMHDIPDVPLPEGFRIRAMRPDEGGLWTDIERDAERYFPIEDDLFADQFGIDLPALEWRGFIVENDRGMGVATTTAWYDRTYKGEDYGQIHWVAVREPYQGRGLGKALMSHVLREMAQWHDKAFLGTQTKRIPAIRMYLDFGFVPDLDGEGAREAWREVRAVLDHPVLRALDL